MVSRIFFKANKRVRGRWNKNDWMLIIIAARRWISEVQYTVCSISLYVSYFHNKVKPEKKWWCWGIEFLIPKQYHAQCGNSRDFSFKSLPITEDKVTNLENPMVINTVRCSQGIYHRSQTGND